MKQMVTTMLSFYLNNRLCSVIADLSGRKGGLFAFLSVPVFSFSNTQLSRTAISLTTYGGTETYSNNKQRIANNNKLLV